MIPRGNVGPCVSYFPSVFTEIYYPSSKTSSLVVLFVFGLGKLPHRLLIRMKVFSEGVPSVSFLLSIISLPLSRMGLAVSFTWTILFYT